MPKKKAIRPFKLSKVREAREAIVAKSKEVYDLYMATIKQAVAEGDSDAALKAIQWLLEHLPPDEDGTRLLAESIDKPKPVEKGPAGPAIQIGFALGGMPLPKTLPPSVEVIETEKVEDGK